jgi:hypothetical protein
MLVVGRHSCFALLLSLLLLAKGCGSSETSITAPSAGSRCGVSIQTPQTPLPAAGGSGTLTIAAARECTWSAATDAPWLNITGGRDGQGDGIVRFTAAPNPDPVTRRGAVVLNDERAEIVQAAGACEITFAGDRADFSAAGGVGHVDLRASSAMCGWSAAATTCTAARPGRGMPRERVSGPDRGAREGRSSPAARHDRFVMRLGVGEPGGVGPLHGRCARHG